MGLHSSKVLINGDFSILKIGMDISIIEDFDIYFMLNLRTLDTRTYKLRDIYSYTNSYDTNEGIYILVKRRRNKYIIHKIGSNVSFR
jgi:hypothetical protein